MKRIRFAAMLVGGIAVLATFSSAAGTVGYTALAKTPYCFVEGGKNLGLEIAYSGWYYKDSSGVSHPFSGTSYKYSNSDPSVCGPSYTTGFVATSSTTGGYYTLTTNGALGTVTVSATLFPQYQILSLLYDAPGNESTNGFTNTTFYGPANSIGSSFSNGTTFTFTHGGGLFGMGSGSTSVSFTQANGTTNAFQDTITYEQGIALDSHRNPVDHTNDLFWIWLNPEVIVTTSPGVASSASYAVSPPSGQIVYAVKVTVAELQTPSTIPLRILEPIVINGVTYPGLSHICAHPLPAPQCTQANACGCVPSDFTQILGTDPIISITSDTPPSQIDAKRYFLLDPQPSPLPFLEYGSSDTIVNDQDQNSQTQTETTAYSTSFSTTFGIASSGTPVDWSLTFTKTTTFTWTQAVSLTNFSGTSHEMSLVLATSTPACAEPIEVYEDYDYHTFVAVPAATPPVGCDSQ